MGNLNSFNDPKWLVFLMMPFTTGSVTTLKHITHHKKPDHSVCSRRSRIWNFINKIVLRIVPST